MDTAKVVSGKAAKPNSVPTEDVDVLLDLNNEDAQRVSQQEVKQRQLITEKSLNPLEGTNPTDLRRHSLSKSSTTPGPKTAEQKAESPPNSAAPKRRALRFRSENKPNSRPKCTNPQKSNATSGSPRSRSRSSRNGRPSHEGQIARRIPRSTSNHEGLPRTSSLKTISFPRSSSERQYGVNVLRKVRVSPRSNSRRWQGDDFGIPEQEVEGELDSFFRFMEECTQAVWAVLREIPVFICRLPSITMDILKWFIPVLRQPTVPLVEELRDQEETP